MLALIRVCGMGKSREIGSSWWGASFMCFPLERKDALLCNSENWKIEVYIERFFLNSYLDKGSKAQVL